MPPFPFAPVGAVAGSLINAVSTGIQNRKSRKWSEQMYNRQYADNLDFWRMQNEYNNPASQMKRMQEAGLNPALMYGKGASAGQAGPISSPDVQSAQFRSPEFGSGLAGVGGAINQYLDADIKLAQIDNLKAQNTNLIYDGQLKDVQAQEAARDLDRKSGLGTYHADLLAENVRKARVTTDIALREDVRRAIMTGRNVIESSQRVLESQARTANYPVERKKIQALTNSIHKDARLKQLDIELRKTGIQPNDKIYWRVLIRALTDYARRNGTTLNLNNK